MVPTSPLFRSLCCLLLCVSLAACAKRSGDDLADKYKLDDEELIDHTYIPRDDGKPLTSAELAAFRSLGQIDRNLSQEETAIVELHFKYFVHERRQTMERFIERSARYLPYAKKVFVERGMPEELAYLFMVESGGNPNAVSPVGAAGLWQFMPYTGRKFGLVQNKWIDERRDPFKATFAASDYLLKLYGDFSDWHLAVAAYNAGEGKIGRALNGTGATSFFELCRLDGCLEEKARLRDETRQYVPRLIAMAKIMRNLKSLGFTEPNPASAYNLAPITVPPGTNLSGLARSLNLTWDEFLAMNPAYRRTASPPTLPTTAYVPPVQQVQAQTWLASNESRIYAGWSDYTVKRGDTLSAVAKRHKVSVAALREANGFTGLPKAGTVILIPGKVTEPDYAALDDRSSTAKGSKGKYQVRQGDSLYSLAKAWGTDVESIRKANRLGSGTHLSIGQRLVIPANSRTAPKAAAAAKKPVPQSAARPAGNAVAGAAGTHTVRQGESLYSIARANNTTVDALSRANNIQAGDKLRIGRVLALPGAGSESRATAPAAAATPTRTATVTVKQGDTLFSIARAHKTTVDALRKANNMTANETLKVGRSLRLP